MSDEDFNSPLTALGEHRVSNRHTVGVVGVDVQRTLALTACIVDERPAHGHVDAPGHHWYLVVLQRHRVGVDTGLTVLVARHVAVVLGVEPLDGQVLIGVHLEEFIVRGHVDIALEPVGHTTVVIVLVLALRVVNAGEICRIGFHQHFSAHGDGVLGAKCFERSCQLLRQPLALNLAKQLVSDDQGAQYLSQPELVSGFPDLDLPALHAVEYLAGLKRFAPTEQPGTADRSRPALVK